MKVEEMSQHIDTRPVESEDEVSVAETHQLPNNRELIIEYRPRDHRLEPDGLYDLADEGFFEGITDEVIATRLYDVLVQILYPGSAYVDRPEDVIPMIVEVRNKTRDEFSEVLTTAGTYR